MRTRISTISQLKELFISVFLSKTNNVSKVSDGSVLSGVAYGVAKVAQKAQKDVALVESRLFPSKAYGVYLDDIARDRGIAPRFGSVGSSAFILLQAAAGTQYIAETHTFNGGHNITFELTEDFTMPAIGYAYVLVRSTIDGAKTLVDAYTINEVTPTPVGHISVTNEYRSEGGADLETDEMLRARIISSGNISAMDTMARLTQLFISINDNVLRLFNYGMNGSGQVVIGVLSRSGAAFTQDELNALAASSADHLSLTDSRSYGSTLNGIYVQNIDWHYVDVDFRVSLIGGYFPEAVRRAIQVSMSGYIDYTVWKATSRVEWYDLFDIVKSAEGVKYCPDSYFLPRVDITAPIRSLPRIRKFIMRNMDGIIIYSDEVLKPMAFMNSSDRSYQETILITE